jgi:N-acetylneuraminic acid mutarotase
VGAGGAINGKFYVAGGQQSSEDNPNGYSNKLDSYDPATDTWVSLSPMPTRRLFVAGAILNDKLYIIGGHGTNSDVLDNVEAYDPITDVWATKAPLLMARHRLAAGVIQDAAGDLRLLAVGGWDGGAIGPLLTVEAYSP